MLKLNITIFHSTDKFPFDRQFFHDLPPTILFSGKIRMV